MDFFFGNGNREDYTVGNKVYGYDGRYKGERYGGDTYVNGKMESSIDSNGYIWGRNSYGSWEKTGYVENGTTYDMYGHKTGYVD